MPQPTKSGLTVLTDEEVEQKKLDERLAVAKSLRRWKDHPSVVRMIQMETHLPKERVTRHVAWLLTGSWKAVNKSDG